MARVRAHAGIRVKRPRAPSSGRATPRCLQRGPSGEAGSGSPSLISPCPRSGTIELADAGAFQHCWFEIRRVHGDGAASPFLSVLIVRDATARPAAKVGPNLAPPGITHQATLRRLDTNRARPVVRPKCAIAATDGTIAARHGARCSTHVNADGTAVAGRGQHRRLRLVGSAHVRGAESRSGSRAKTGLVCHAVATGRRRLPTASHGMPR
jgi:hypothetical protein